MKFQHCLSRNQGCYICGIIFFALLNISRSNQITNILVKLQWCFMYHNGKMCRSVLVLAALICMKFKVSMLSSCMIDLVSLCSVLFSFVNAKIVFLLF